MIILNLWTKNPNDMICSVWNLQRDRLKLVILGHFLPFYSPKNPKNQNFEKTDFFVVLGHFLHFHSLPNNLENQNFEKLKKQMDILSFYTWAP